MRALLLLAMTGLMIFTGCGRPVPRVDRGIATQELHLGNGTEPQDLDPHTVQGVSEHNLISSLIEGLVSEHPVTGEPVPGTAARWDISPDGKVYTFHLRPEARWSNGETVTAHDFVRSFQRILNPRLGSEYAYMLFAMKGAEDYQKGKLTDFTQVGVKALDDRTLRIELNHAVPYFLSLLNHYTWWPVHVPTVEKFGDPAIRGNRWTLPGNFVGNGPFVLESWRVSHSITVRKSTSYWDAATVKLNRIHFYGIESADTEERAFRAGQLHVTYDPVPPAKIAVYREKQPHLMRIDPYLGTYFYRVNVLKPPLNDVRVRRALALALNREAIVETVTRGGQLPAYHFTPAGTAGYTSRTKITGTRDDARRLLAEAGFPNGKGFPKMQIHFNTSDTHRPIAEAIQQMWNKELNIEVGLLNEEWKVYMDTQNARRYDVSRAGWIGDYDDPSTFLETFTTDSGNNRTGWSNARYDDLIKQAGREGELKKRLEIFQQAEAILLEELPILPIYFYTRPFLIHPSVRGWHPNILDHHPYKHVWLEEEGK
jgi:oligopeptide transport system substrate-binding protein